MPKILELPENLANQIAAGEVVERPASVVKELVENSIDAKSTKIVVNIVESGLSKIQVIDNGSGMEAADVALSLKRHATSKIKTNADLFKIATLGFRGEALPSIASVSQLTIETSNEIDEAGTKLIAKAGKIESLAAAVKFDGTKITVENLFFNTPARLKYIKSLQAELAAITDVLNRLALAHPEISFTLVNEGKEMLKTAGNGDLRQVIAAVYGLHTARQMREISAEDLDFKISGWVSLPELTRASRNYISVLINGRYIKNFALNRAIIEGYGSKLMVGRFPLAVVAISIDPRLADVNVHPTKQEVRLSKEKELMQLLSQAIRETLSDEVLIPNALENLTKSLPKVEEKSVKSDEKGLIYDNIQQDFFAFDKIEEPKVELFDERSEVAEKFDKPAELVKFDEPVKEKFPELTYLAQLHSSYLLAQSADGFYIIDQHAAQERIKYEYWRDKIGEVELDQQGMLFPEIVDLSADEFLKVKENLDLLQQAGVYLQEYGEHQFILREHPVWMNEDEIASATHELMDLLLSNQEVSVKKYREDLAIMIACKSSIKANMPLDDESAKALLAELATAKNPYNCPHGRPSMVKFSSTDVEKMFRRIMQGHLSKSTMWKNEM